MRKNFFAIFFSVLILVSSSGLVYAHGVTIEYNANMSYEIAATYDTGEPMKGAHITIYAPDNPSTPWMEGVCDENGQFRFTPDITKEGTWLIQTRLAGHGASINIPIGEDMSTSGGRGYSKKQIILMIACVVWGFIGTALYFKRR